LALTTRFQTYRCTATNDAWDNTRNGLLVTTILFSAHQGLETLRAHSMKRCATGLVVRFFKVVIAIGQGENSPVHRQGFECSRLTGRTPKICLAMSLRG
jgi:hypothetical protein